MWHQPFQRLSTPLPWIFRKTRYKKLVIHVESNASAVSVLKRAENSGESCQNVHTHLKSICVPTDTVSQCKSGVPFVCPTTVKVVSCSWSTECSTRRKRTVLDAYAVVTDSVRWSSAFMLPSTYTTARCCFCPAKPAQTISVNRTLRSAVSLPLFWNHKRFKRTLFIRTKYTKCEFSW